MFIGIDGTGTDHDYDTIMDRSFIRRIYEQRVKEGRGKNLYLPGPDILGRETQSIAARAAKVALEWLGADGGTLAIAGWSRGASAAIVAAASIEAELEGELASFSAIARKMPRGAIARKMPRVVLFLFDAVDRDWGTDSSTISPIVWRAYHAIRSGAIGSWRSFGNSATGVKRGRMVDDDGRSLYQGLQSNVRESSPPGGKEGGTLVIQQWFAGTHAAIGGLPWEGDKPRPYILIPRRPNRGAIFGRQEISRGFGPNYRPGDAIDGWQKISLGFGPTQDADAERHVRSWMSQWLIVHGVLDAPISDVPVRRFERGRRERRS
jgi:hypothetical protein